MNLSFGHPSWLLILLLVAAAGISWWTYRETIPRLNNVRRWLLGGLRAAALALILFLLFEPLLQKSSTRTTPPVVGVLIDASESMALADSLLGDDGASTQDVFDSLRKISTDLDFRFYSFGKSIASLDSTRSLVLGNSRTNISGALRDIASALADEPLRAVILVSDGLYNSGANPLHISQRYGVPILSIAVGDSTTHRDVRIIQVLSNEIAYAGTTVPVRVRIRNDGFAGARLTVNLSSQGEVLSRQVLSLPTDGGELEVDLEFETKTEGRMMLQVDINRFAQEATYRNNTRRFSIEVLDQKKNILVLSGAPSPDVSAITRILRSDETADVSRFTQSPDGTFYEAELPEDLSEFDLLVAIGFPGIATPAAVTRRIAEAVRGGLSILFVQDSRTDLGAIEREWNGVLPSVLQAIRPGFVQGRMDQTALASSHAIFDIGPQRDPAVWDRLPPLILNESRWRAVPGASILATTRIRGVSLDDPLIVVARLGRVRSAAFLAHGFWRWTNMPEDLQKEASLFKNLFANTIQWLFAKEDDRPVRVRPSESSYAEGESVVFLGEVYDEVLHPVSDASLTLELTAPDGQLFPYELSPLGNGRFTIDVGSLPAGLYAYSAAATKNNASLGESSGSFMVGKRTLEYRITRADYALMEQIATRSGGQLVSSRDLSAIPDLLEAMPTFVPVREAVLSQLRLWQIIPFLIVVMVLLTLEWFFRKRFGMV